ncbi:hypothetical protein BX070DRAFT_219239 [Coemansia spiralis]|nr:hypothetical protein BX070DRAFT_219239 [Coemansia spiralis]
MAAAVNSTPQISQINSYTSQAAQHNAAAAALLAASGMHSVMLPTIPSVSTSLQGTPAPGERLSLSVSMEDDPLLTTTVAANATAALPASISMATTIPTSTAASGGDVSMQPFDMAAFGGLSPHSFAAANQITSSMAAATINIPTALQEQSEPIQATPKKKQPTPRRRKAAAGVSAATAAVAATAEETIDDYDLLSSDDEDGSPHAKDGMPLTPDAPGSGRPGSLRHLTADERRARRLQRNRLAAKECRQKKKAYIQNLEDQVHDLRKDNERLRKEIEELNAKLTLGGMRANSSATTPVLDTRQLLSAEYADSSMDSLSSPTLSSKRPRVAVRSTSNARLANGGD